jgi:glutathione S-transferase
MSLELYYHPLSSYCWKALIALYENDTPFKPRLVDLSDPMASAEFAKLWPIRKFPVLRDHAREQVVPEASIIIEYLAEHYPGKLELVPQAPDLAWQLRLWDRFYDLYVHTPMQKAVADVRRAAENKDPIGVAEARAQLETAYAIIDERMATRAWALGDAFSMADCAAAPALHYANFVVPLNAYAHASAYLGRLMRRPAALRVLAEAEPYSKLFPLAR